ncbi:hypothetical protein [Streptomyces sp. V4I2]|uniref:hypothetical protein n=1 Tax=Streptomyces sp. V4I2 TaxID=3042280 RepID=UPI002789A1CC|nr:hypothetical protein [Streptomyces sp. V4I2]MDQ1052061.1 uncharacterized protein YidB (DUF937 family) [Streptomyces sp. V4I2]
MSGDMGGGQPDPKDNPKRLPRPRLLTRARVGWPPALRELKDLLYEVYLEAGAPSLDDITGDIAADDDLPGAPSRDTISRVITDSERPKQQSDVVAVATVLARRAAWDAPDLARRVRELWVRARMAQGAGRPISDLRDDVRLVLDRGLGIHPALDTEGARDRFGILPDYVPRDHDARLRTVVDAAVAGHSGIAVLVGGSSTGKTRALWEAVATLPDGWRLWHPLTPTAPDAALAALPDIAPKTVVWLNEAQHYLAPDPLGEQVAAGLRKLLTDPSRAPVLILGTLWLEHWDTLTTRDRHPGARALLGGHKIDVPKAFTPADLAALDATGDADPRLTHAAQHACDAQVTQYLAGVPYLIDRYHAAEGATLALTHAAMDARRLGAGLHIPLDWLADAAPGYLTDTEYHMLDGDWLSKALAYVITPCNGIPGILTAVTTSRPRNQRTSRRPAASSVLADRRAPSQQGPRYLLADYLDQHGRRHRAEKIPPIDFWSAASTHAHPADLTTIARAAWARGLYRDATQLHKRATTQGDSNAASTLVYHLHTLHPADHRPAAWAAAHVALDNPYAVIRLLVELREAGAHEQIRVLAERAAAQVALDDSRAVARLLEGMREAGAHEQIRVLAERAAAQVALDDSQGVVRLLVELREAGAHEQIRVLAERAAAQVALDDPAAVAEILEGLQVVVAGEQIAALLARGPAAHVVLDDPAAVAEMLEGLQVVAAKEQITALLARDPAANVLCHNPRPLGRLLEALHEVGAQEQVTVLAERAATDVLLDDPGDVARLLDGLWEVGAQEQVTVLAERAAAGVLLDDPGDVTRLLAELHEVGAQEQATLLAERDAARDALNESYAVAEILNELQQGQTWEQIAALLDRDPAAHVVLTDLYAVALLLEELREFGAQAQVAALIEGAAADEVVDDVRAVVRLLEGLRQAGAQEHATALPERAASCLFFGATYTVGNILDRLREAGLQEHATALPERAASCLFFGATYTVGNILDRLREAGLQEQVAALLDWNPAAQVVLEHPHAVARLLDWLREGGMHEQVAAFLDRNPGAQVALGHPQAVTKLLNALQGAGAHEQCTVLTERLPAAGQFDLFIDLGGNRQEFRFGREPNGLAAPSWTWDDLE